MFIVIDTFNTEWPTIVCDPDTGKPLSFDTPEEAQEEADDCHEAKVVEI